MALALPLWAEEVAKVNINQASVEELAQLKGIGLKYAERIVEYREKHGAFEKAEDIMNVSGIG
ncbi:MAG: helix-hairpin-helix domain-containing protein, partial [Desulfobacterales bacterium]|nr:helix-hairpin-helix domain-containing protein [Desulfobacterales bacterium]